MPATSRLMPRAPERIETARLLLRRPTEADAQAIFDSYASDPLVTRLVGWPTHRTLDDTRAFLAFDAAQWERQPAGAYLAFPREGGPLLGSSGLLFENPERAMTGYVFAQAAWGRGFAAEALAAMVAVARETGVRRLYAVCHHAHAASAHVLEKCHFAREGVLRGYVRFPNLDVSEPQDVLCYAILL
jgi:ribosomal-protein-alanine N-acetyltransferase